MATFRKDLRDSNDYHEDEVAFEASIQSIIRRCKSAEIEIRREENSFMYEAEYYVLMPQGRGHREVNIWTAEMAQRFESEKFEEYRFIAGYSAIYSETDDVIEAAVRPLNVRSFRIIRSRLFGLPSTSEADGITRLICFENADGQKRIEIGLASSTFTAITQTFRGDAISVKLIGYSVKQHDAALQTLELVTDALFMQLDLVTGVPLSLARDRQNRGGIIGASGLVEAIREMPFPQHEYDHGPVSLYQYGRSADGMPLLQFLAFYQAVEFYYPTYSDADARRKVRNVLKDPNFRESREADIGRLLSIVQAKAGRYGSERAQLKSTINECVDVQGLLLFIRADKARLEFFKTNTKKDRHTRLGIEDHNADLLNQLSNRLYEIRCEIVHSKDIDDSEESGRALLLPFSSEADQLEHDIALMQFVAQRVIIASSKAV